MTSPFTRKRVLIENVLEQGIEDIFAKLTNLPDVTDAEIIDALGKSRHPDFADLYMDRVVSERPQPGWD